METTEVPVQKKRGRPRSFDREAALEAAMLVFWRHGYEATSLSDLTAAMGINPPSLYATFGDKEHLFMAAIEHYLEGPGGAAALIFAQQPTARSAVERLLQETAHGLTREETPPCCMLVTATMNCTDASAHIQVALAKYRAASEAGVRVRIANGISDGELPADTDAAALARFYSTVLHGMSTQAMDGASREELLAIGAAAMRAWPSA